MMNNQIFNFLTHFEKAKETFTSGCCYWFAFILAERFDGKIFYNPKENHFACKIKVEDDMFDFAYKLYDINGAIRYIDDYIEFTKYKKIDSTHYNRIIRDCVMMSKEDLYD